MMRIFIADTKYMIGLTRPGKENPCFRSIPKALHLTIYEATILLCIWMNRLNQFVIYCCLHPLPSSLSFLQGKWSSKFLVLSLTY
jgi:hypothetical protein